MTQLKCCKCKKPLTNGDTVKFIKFSETTEMFHEACYKLIREFIEGKTPKDSLEEFINETNCY